MKIVAVGELIDRINEILRMVEEEGESFEVTNHGEVIARLIPKHSFRTSDETTWADIDLLAAEIGTYIPKKVDAVDILNNVRRDLYRQPRISAYYSIG